MIRRKGNIGLFNCLECIKSHVDDMHVFPVRKMDLNGQKLKRKSNLHEEKEEIVKKAAEEKVEEHWTTIQLGVFSSCWYEG